MATGTARDKVLNEQYRNEAITKKPTDGNDYGGLQIHAFRGLHEFVAEGLMRRCQAGGRVVDLAAGTGAPSGLVPLSPPGGPIAKRSARSTMSGSRTALGTLSFLRQWRR